jgi:hypothetical protein
MSDVPSIAPKDDTPRRHRWDDENILRIPAHESDNGCSQTHRTCLHCQIVRITMHPPQGFPWPEFILPGKVMSERFDLTPPCHAEGEP